MNPADFTEEKNGRLIKTQRDHWAFSPNPLPPQLTLSWDLVNQLSEADRALSELAGTARTLPNPHLLIGPFIRREAVLSSRIEGTQASLSDLLFFEASGSVDPKAPDAREVANYVKAMEYGLVRLKKFPLSLRFIREVHEHLMDDVRGEHLTPRRISPLTELDWTRSLHADGRQIRSTSGRRNGTSLRPIRSLLARALNGTASQPSITSLRRFIRSWTAMAESDDSSSPSCCVKRGLSRNRCYIYAPTLNATGMTITVFFWL